MADLQEFYKAAKIRFDEDPEFKLRAQQAVVTLQVRSSPDKNGAHRIGVAFSFVRCQVASAAPQTEVERWKEWKDGFAWVSRFVKSRL